MSPNTGKGLASYFEEKRPYDEEDIRAVVEFLAKKRTTQEQDLERAPTKSKQTTLEETQDSRSVPNAELRAILEIFRGEQAKQFQKRYPERGTKREERNGEGVL